MSLQNIPNGTSNTMLLGEKCMNMGLLGQTMVDDEYGFGSGWSCETVRWAIYQPMPDFAAPATGSNPDTMAAPLGGHYCFGSSHPQVFQAAFCDGSGTPNSLHC